MRTKNHDQNDPRGGRDANLNAAARSAVKGWRGGMGAGMGAIGRAAGRAVQWGAPLAVPFAVGLVAVGLVACGGNEEKTTLPPPIATAVPVTPGPMSPTPAAGEAGPSAAAEKLDPNHLPDLLSNLDGAAPGSTETSFKVADAGVTETGFHQRRSISEAIEELNKTRYPKIVPTPTPFISENHQVLETAAKSAGAATIAKIDSTLSAAAGPRAEGRVGDYLLQNDKVKLTFAYVVPVDDPSKPLEVFANKRFDRRQGALIDVCLADKPVDFLVLYTQIPPDAPGAAEVDYDSAEFVSRDNPPAVGLRLTASVFPDNVESRFQTTYWLAPGETRVDVETRVISGKEGLLLADNSDWGPGAIVTGTDGVVESAKGTLKRQPEWILVSAGSVSAGMTPAKGAKFDGSFGASIMRVTAPAGEDKAQRRSLWFGDGNFSSVTDQIFAANEKESPTGALTGTILSSEDGKPATNSWVDILWQQRPADVKDSEAVRQIKFDPRLFTRVSCGDDGKFKVLLPANVGGNQGRYFVATAGRARAGGRSSQGIVIKEGETTQRDLKVSEAAKLFVKLVDSKTSETMVGRVKFEPIGANPSSSFLDISNPEGYLNYFYVPLAGREIELAKGSYMLTATAGIEYDLSKVDVDMEYGQTTPAEIVMDRVSPSKGYMDLDVGAMTKATPGVVFTAEQRVLMAAGEGLNWIVSGDLNALTDFEPAIEKLGLAGKMKSSMGFRAHLPKRPEWGEFLIYPISAGMPDPAKAREQWEGLADAKPFVAKLRELYPGALIEAVNPFSTSSKRDPEGDGYFYQKGWNVYEMAYNDHLRTEELDFGIDAVNVFPARKFWNLNWEKDFLYKNHLHNRFYVPAPVSNARVALGGEPGYPRILVRTDEDDVSKIPEAKLFEAMKAGKWQVTTGPFIDASFDGRKPGDEMYKPEQNANVKYKVTAPPWATTSTIDFAKDGMMNKRDVTPGAIPTSATRQHGEEKLDLYPDLKGFDDTTASVEITSPDQIPIIPQFGIGVQSFAIDGPMILDTNGNKVYDPPKEYRDTGK